VLGYVPRHKIALDIDGSLGANDAHGLESLPEEYSSQCMRRREIDAA
jgi:hypothetical protein